MTGKPGSRRVPRATRIVLAPPESWDEARMMDAARDLPTPDGPLIPGDEIGGFVVIRVEPTPGSKADAATAVDVEPYAARTGDAYHVAIVIDAAASMVTPWTDDITRADAARWAVATFLTQAHDVVATATTYAFSSDLRVLQGPDAPGELDAPTRDETMPGGPSRLSGALNTVLARLASRTEPAAILLLSDAAADEQRLAETAARAERLGIPIHVLGLAPEADPALEALARGTGGIFRNALVPPSLRPIHNELATSLGKKPTWVERRFPEAGEAGFEELVPPKRPFALWGFRKEKSP